MTVQWDKSASQLPCIQLAKRVGAVLDYLSLFSTGESTSL